MVLGASAAAPPRSPADREQLDLQRRRHRRADLHDRTVQSHIVRRHLEAPRHPGHEFRHHRLHRPPEHTRVRPRHAHVADKRRPFRQHRRIRRRHVRVRPDHRRHAPVEIPPKRQFLRRRLRMHFHHDRVALRTQLLDHPIRRQKRAIRLQAHELPSQDREYRHAKSPRRHNQVIPARIRRRQVRRPANAIDLRDLRLPPALIPHMIAERDRIDPRLEQRTRDRARDPIARRRVFAIRNHEVDRMLRAQPLEFLVDDIPPRPTHDVADK